MSGELTDPTPGIRWGHIEEGKFVALPKTPLLLGGFGRPPFDVTLPNGDVRHVIEEPTP